MAASLSISKNHKGDPQNTGECQLLGSFAILVQAALGVLALSSLVFKRWRERPQRPVKVWAFDASKQVVGSALLHLANLFMSMFSSGQLQYTATSKYKPNPCSFYLLNLGIDTTLGIPILIFILRILTALIHLTPIANPPESIESGNYGSPPRYWWWLKQCMIYFLGLIGMKSCVFVVFQLFPWIVKVGDWALRWTEGNEAVQIAFVMLIFPLIMNAMQYYIIDTFIKKKSSAVDDEAADDGGGGGHAPTGEEDSDRTGLLAGNTSVDIVEEDEVRKAKVNVTTSKSSDKPSKTNEYNPDEDGEVISSSSGGSNTTADPEQQPLVAKIPETTE